MFSLPPVFFHTCQLTEQSEVDWSALASSVRPSTRCALVQRSCGYAWRRSLTVADIQRIVTIVKVRQVCRLYAIDYCAAGKRLCRWGSTFVLGGLETISSWQSAACVSLLHCQCYPLVAS